VSKESRGIDRLALIVHSLCRHRWVSIGLFGLCVLFGASVPDARAQGVDEFGPYGGREDLSRLESPQNFALELRFGPYLPNVDQEFSGAATPFRDVFGSTDRLMVGTEFDWQAFRVDNVLSLGPGVGVSYTALSARAPLASGDGRADQRTKLKILPTWLVGVLRIDALARLTPVPLAFSAKVGLGHALWWASDGDGTSTADDGSKGRGRSYGYTYSAGAMLDLSFLEPSRANHLDAATGVNHMYLIFEWYALELDGFGSGNVMNVGDRNWMLGLAMDW